MNKTFVLFDRETMRAVGYVSLEETLLYLAVPSSQVAAELLVGAFEPAATYKIVDGYAVKE